MSLQTTAVEQTPSDRIELDPIVRLKEFLRITGIGRSTAYKLIADGTIESPVRISARTVGWRLSAVKAFLDSRPNTGGQQ